MIGQTIPQVAGPDARGGVDARGDRKSPGGPRNITPEQERAAEGDLDKPPGESGFDRGSRNSKLLAGHVRDKSDVACSQRTVPSVADRLGFSFRNARTMPYNSAAAGERRGFSEDVADAAGRRGASCRPSTRAATRSLPSRAARPERRAVADPACRGRPDSRHAGKGHRRKPDHAFWILLHSFWPVLRIWSGTFPIRSM